MGNLVHDELVEIDKLMDPQLTNVRTEDLAVICSLVSWCIDPNTSNRKSMQIIAGAIDRLLLSLPDENETTSMAFFFDSMCLGYLLLWLMEDGWQAARGHALGHQHHLLQEPISRRHAAVLISKDELAFKPEMSRLGLDSVFWVNCSGMLHGFVVVSS